MQPRLTAVLVEKFGHAFSGYDLTTGQQRFSVALPQYPHEFVVDREGRFGYVGHYGVQTFAHAGAGGHEVFVIDIARGEHVLTLDCEPYSRIHGLQIDTRNRVYALSEHGNTLLVFEDPHARQVPDRAVPAGGIKSHLFVVSRDGERAYISNLLSHTVTRVHPYDACVPPAAVNAGGRPEGCCLNRDETVLFVASRDDHSLSMIDTGSMKVMRTVRTGEDPTRIYLTPDNRLLVVNYGERSIRVFDPRSLEALGRVDTVAKPIAVSIHPDGQSAYVALNDNSVGVLDLSSLTLRHGFSTGKEPDGLAILAL
ncbi:YncE family protein [Caballeronia sp. SEWSISQ10-4 2]|uniref:YncE family protein n=1 Tax=Caballeronia sp. SEWSISQ10-4 2 TaxID=2937438 RepID=UPI00264CCF86|nr:YncE family protein [Caballeronia sp. SEWSISQ10-4 2]MDN7178288.1 YncE family protein [Caballeronia sp. SEWSISQ10-4 2]